MALPVIAALVLWAWPQPAHAHVGSPDVFLEGRAGPYTLFVTVRPPEVIPGVAEVQVRAAQGQLKQVRITPLPLGQGTRFAPTPDEARPLAEDPQLFTGHLWMMAAGSWEVRVMVEGAAGPGVLSVPVPALPQRTGGMQTALGAALALLLLVLVAGVISVAGAVVRESHLEAGEVPDPLHMRRGRRTMLATAAALLVLIYGGARWWQAEARAYERYVYRPLAMQAEVRTSSAAGEGPELRLTLAPPDRRPGRRIDDLIHDHAHLMHLFVVRMPSMDRVLHLHPELGERGVFVQRLPSLEPGRYALYADIVHQSGLPETLSATLEVPAALTGSALSGDDSSGVAAPLSPGPVAGAAGSPLPDGGRMRLDMDAAALVARRPTHLRFRVEDAGGQPARDLEPYMGMLGHAAVVRTDGGVFAHLHPTGSVPMPALDLVSERPAGGAHAGHAAHEAAALPNIVSFPYGFPGPGQYRLFEQVKRSGQVHTGVFDVSVGPGSPSARR
jgi:hypothetical protein